MQKVPFRELNYKFNLLDKILNYNRRRTIIFDVFSVETKTILTLYRYFYVLQFSRLRVKRRYAHDPILINRDALHLESTDRNHYFFL